MTLPRTAADVLADHVSFEVECIDRMYLNVYVPQLQYATGLVSYIHRQLGKPVASTAALAPVSEAFTRSVRSFAASCGIPWVDSSRDSARTTWPRSTWRASPEPRACCSSAGRRRRSRCSGPASGTADGSSYPWIAAETGVASQFYCYCVDEDFGSFFLKFCSYFPFSAKLFSSLPVQRQLFSCSTFSARLLQLLPVQRQAVQLFRVQRQAVHLLPVQRKLCINGNEWAKGQAARAGIGFTPLDNAFAAVNDVPALQAICHGLGPAQIDALLRKWLARLPHPFSPADRAAGYRYDLSILQAEFSLTQMLDKPVSGRIFFEQVIRDSLDLGRPDRISLIFGRSIYRGRKNHTPGTFATRVVTDGVTPRLHVLSHSTRRSASVCVCQRW